MIKLKLNEWASIGEIITSLAVVASLVYVAFEIKQNTDSLQQSSYQSVLDRLSSHDMMVAADKDLHRIVSSAENPDIELSEEDWSRFEHFAFPKMGEWEYMFLASEANAISQIQWTAFEPYFTQLYCQPGYQKFWKNNRFAFAAAFQTYVDSITQSRCSS